MRFPRSVNFPRRCSSLLCICFLLLPSFAMTGQTRVRAMPPGTMPQTVLTRVPGAYKSRDDQGSFSRVVLENDLVLLIKQHDAFPLASLTVHIHWPSLPPTAENELLIRLAAASLFNFAEAAVATQTSEPLETLGGVAEMEVKPEALLWTVTLPVESLSNIYALVARRLKTSALTPAELSTVLQKLGQGLVRATSKKSGQELFLLAGFPSPMEIPHDATPALVESVSTFLKQILIPSQMTVCVVGAIDRERVIQRVAEQFLSIPVGTTKPAPKTPSPETGGLRYFRIDSPDGLAHVSVNFPLPSTPFSTAAILSAILTEGEMSLLHQTLQRTRNLVPSVDSRLFWLNKERILSIRFDCLKENIDEATVYVFARIQQFLSTAPSVDEILRARQQFVLNWYLGHQAPASVGIDMAEFESRSEFSLYSKLMKEVETVTPEEVHKAARNRLTPEHMVVVEQWPRGPDKRPFVTDTYKEFLSLALPRTLSKIGKKAEHASANLPAIPEPQTRYAGNLDRTQLKASGWKKYSILRGPDVYVNEFHLTPLVTIAALYPGGALFESADTQAGYTALATRGAVQATKDRTHDELWFQLEAMGATLVPLTTNDLFGYVLQVPSNAAQPAIEIFLDILLEPLFSPDDVNATKSQLILNWRSQLECPETFQDDQLMSTFFSQTNFYSPLIRRIGSVRKATEKDIAAWWNSLQKETAPVMIIFGDTEGTELVAPFARKLSSSRWKPTFLQAISNFKTPKLPALFKDRLSFLSVPQISVGFGGLNFSVPSAEAMDVGRWLFKDLLAFSRVYDFYYLRYFTGEIRSPLEGSPTNMNGVTKQISSLISTDTAVAAAQKSWKTERELMTARPIDKTLALFRRTVHFPSFEAVTKVEDEASQMTLTQLKEALSATFNLQNMLACQVSP